MKIQNSTPFISTVGKPDSPGNSRVDAGARLKPATEQLQSTSLRQNLQAASEVDIDKVNQVREAIARGELSLDPDVLAEAVMDMHGR